MISKLAVVETDNVGENVTVGEFSVIRPGVVIGTGAVIYPHVVISPGVVVGDGASQQKSGRPHCSSKLLLRHARTSQITRSTRCSTRRTAVYGPVRTVV